MNEIKTPLFFVSIDTLRQTKPKTQTQQPSDRNANPTKPKTALTRPTKRLSEQETDGELKIAKQINSKFLYTIRLTFN